MTFSPDSEPMESLPGVTPRAPEARTDDASVELPTTAGESAEAAPTELAVQEKSLAAASAANVEPSGDDLPEPPADLRDAGWDAEASDPAAETIEPGDEPIEPIGLLDHVEALELVDADLAPARRRRAAPFLAAFVFGVLAVIAIAAGAAYAFDQQFNGRILPGVHVGSTDLTGLTAGQAASRLTTDFAALGQGSMILSGDGQVVVVTYADLDRHLDVTATVDAALAIGRSGSPPERIVGNIRTAIRGVRVVPHVTYGGDALVRAVTGFAKKIDRAAADAGVSTTKDGLQLQEAVVGRKSDPETALTAAAGQLVVPDAPSQIFVEMPVANIDPAISTDAGTAAVGTARQIARDVAVTDQKASWTIPAATIRTWITFGSGADGTFQPSVTVPKDSPVFAPVAKAILQSPLDASFLFGSDGKIVGVSPGHNGRKLDTAATTALLTDLLRQRGAGVDLSKVTAAVTITKPTLSTEQATASAPLMVAVSTWTTRFQIYEGNGFGANIWIPAMALDRYVVAPGALFDFWKAIGPVTRAKGYVDGGAIIDGHSEPTGALAGGICSTSTTLFNTVARAGFQLGARKNHYYYITRYPLGLDATVFQSSSGSVQTMSWRNDTKYPVLIRAYKIRESDGAHGDVKFVLYTVPLGRSVSFSTPIVKNVLKATDTVQYTNTLPSGTTKRVEYPDNGMDVWVTRTVRDKTGAIIHQETFFSHYARITGLTLIGTG
ncbi:MAG TPA: VanW family protein [Candidatus Limnocylindrales bacterium]